MDSQYKMPTWDQARELIDGTNSTWTTVNGVNGRKFISKTDTSKYIFFPAAGGWSDTTHGNTGNYAWNWTTKVHESYGSSLNAMYLQLSSSQVVIYSNTRYWGCSVRPVK